MTAVIIAIRKNNWVNITFFAVTTLAGVVGAPVYVYHYSISVAEVALFLFYFGATGLAITVGYHRLFAHATFNTNRVVRFFLLFLGLPLSNSPHFNGPPNTAIIIATSTPTRIPTPSAKVFSMRI